MVAIPGDIVEIKNKILFINGIKQVEDFVIHTQRETSSVTTSARDNFGPITVPENELFVLGDNRDNSFDSRFWGTVPFQFVKGKLMFIYWSWDKEVQSHWVQEQEEKGVHNAGTGLGKVNELISETS